MAAGKATMDGRGKLPNPAIRVLFERYESLPDVASAYVVQLVVNDCIVNGESAITPTTAHRSPALALINWTSHKVRRSC